MDNLVSGLNVCLLFSSNAATLMSAIQKEHKAKNGFLYVMYSGENTYGDQNIWRFWMCALGAMGKLFPLSHVYNVKLLGFRVWLE